jgi:hypothetical protein
MSPQQEPAMTGQNIKTTSRELEFDQLEAVTGGRNFQVDVKWQPEYVRHSKGSGKLTP